MTTNSILKNSTNEQLGLAVEENAYAMFHSMTEALNGEMEETAELSRYHTSPSSPIFKGAFRTLPAHRRKGIGSAMQLERLRIAGELDY